MKDLPDVPFEKVLSYLDLKDLLRARAVSREWHNRIDNFKVRVLCYSEWGRYYIDGKPYLIVDKFAQNFICSSKFESFFERFGGTMLSNLKHLRVCETNVERKGSKFIEIVNFFEELEHLDFIKMDLIGNFELNLPKLKSIRLEASNTISTLHLYAPRLSDIRLWNCYSSLNLICPGSVETLMISADNDLDLKRFKNLKFLYCKKFAKISPTFLSYFDQLREIHLRSGPDAFERLHDQKCKYNLSELKIYYFGVCLASPRDYSAFLDHSDNVWSEEIFNFMNANYSSLAKQLPFHEWINYSRFEAVPDMPTDFWSRLTNFEWIRITEQIEDANHFLSILRNSPTVRTLVFLGPQPQNLFDQLSNLSSNIQELDLRGHDLNLDFTFLFKFTHLTKLCAKPINVYLIPKIFKELKFIRLLRFDCEKLTGSVDVNRSKSFFLEINGLNEGEFSKVDELFQRIIECL